MPIRKYDAVIIHTGEKDITLHFPNDRYVYADLRVAFDDQAKVTVEIKTRRKPRSLSANSYLHMCLQIIADETGNSLDQVKTSLKAMYAKKPLLDKDGEPIFDKKTGEQAMYVQDTHDMNSLECSDFIENMKMFAIDFCNITLPDPEE